MSETIARRHEALAAHCRRLGTDARHRTVFRALQQMEQEYAERAHAARTRFSEAD